MGQRLLKSYAALKKIGQHLKGHEGGVLLFTGDSGDLVHVGDAGTRAEQNSESRFEIKR